MLGDSLLFFQQKKDQSLTRTDASLLLSPTLARSLCKIKVTGPAFA